MTELLETSLLRSKHLFVSVLKHYAMKTYRGHEFLTAALVEVSGQLHAPAALTLGRVPPVLIG
jgi:hypothetical protein